MKKKSNKRKSKTNQVGEADDELLDGKERDQNLDQEELQLGPVRFELANKQGNKQ